MVWNPLAFEKYVWRGRDPRHEWSLFPFVFGNRWEVSKKPPMVGNTNALPRWPLSSLPLKGDIYKLHNIYRYRQQIQYCMWLTFVRSSTNSNKITKYYKVPGVNTFWASYSNFQIQAYLVTWCTKVQFPDHFPTTAKCQVTGRESKLDFKLFKVHTHLHTNSHYSGNYLVLGGVGENRLIKSVLPVKL